jgi:penicillin-binding protein 1A
LRFSFRVSHLIDLSGTKRTFFLVNTLEAVKLLHMIKRWWKTALTIVLATIALPGFFIVAVYSGAFGHLQSKEELIHFKNATATLVLSEDGELIGKFFSENRTNISFGQIPQQLINALISTEDARFFEHNGIDSRSLLRVLFKSVLFNNRSSGGGSTLSQQLAKNMFGRKNYRGFSVLINKTKEAILAHRLENILTKEEILTLYLNTVSFGENIFGVEAASGLYFNKKVQLLNLEESAILIGILKANTFYNPRIHPENAVNRRNLIIKQMVKYEYLNKSEADSLCKLPLVLYDATPESQSRAEYFLVEVKNETEKILQNIQSETGKKWNVEEDGLIITTTLNLTLQNYAVNSFREHLSLMQKRLNDQYQSPSGKILIGQIADRELKSLNLSDRAKEINMRQIFDWNGTRYDSISVEDSLKQALLILHAGFLAIDPLTGAVKAWVGGIDFQSQPYDQIYARRQLASTFKPILYAAAFEDGMDPCQYIDNDSVILSGFEDWSPVNFDHSYGGKYSLAGALSQSMNIPTFNLFLILGFEKLDSLWRKMGFSFTLNNEPSLALGTAEANIMEVAVAYAVFANGGYKIRPRSVISVKTPDGEIIWQDEYKEAMERVLTERSAILISAILQNAIREGTGSSLNSVYGVNLPLAGKTGTSQNYSDAWFTAFNPKLVIVSRVGASSQSIHFNNGADGSGSTLALPLVALTLKKVKENDTLMKELITAFPDLTPEMERILDCPDFKEKKLLERFFDRFQKKTIPYDNGEKKSEKKKRSLFSRLFGK